MKYIAIGHFKESENITSIAMEANSVKDFRRDCVGNEFVAWAVISEKKLEVLKDVDCMDLFDEVKKLTTNHRVWNDICDYIEQCMDIMEDKLQRA
jgi:hypothetical protein